MNRTKTPALVLCCLWAVSMGGCKLNATIDANTAPVAIAGPDQEVAFTGAPLTVTLDGRASGDIDGRLTNFIWRSVDGAVGHPAGAPTATIALGEGRYGFNLWVRDDDGAISDPDQVVIAIGVPLDGPLSGTEDPDGAAGAAAPDPGSFMPDEACLDLNTDTNEACRACACTPTDMAGCADEITRCAANADANVQMLCKALLDCSNAVMCSGAACYTATTCMAEIDAASGGDPINGCNAMMPDSTACAAASAITACKAANCADACGL